jgi:hypothetical protein
MSLTSSLDRAIADPTLTGGTWDGALAYDDPQALNDARAALTSDGRVASVALGGWSLFFTVTVNGRDVFTQVADTDTGIDVATDRGRGPVGASEIALGEAELVALGVSVGDAVEVAADGGRSQTATVVGRAVLAAPRYRALLQGEGAAVTPAFMSRLGNDQSTFLYLVDLRDDAQMTLTIQELREDFGANFAFTRPDRAGVQSLRDVRATIDAVLAVLATFAIAALLHRLVVTSRAQRRQLAVLRAMGLTGGQVATAGATTGLTIVSLATLVAAPLGVIAGVVGWRTIADYLGVVPRPVVPLLTLGMVVAGLVMAGVGAGILAVGRTRRQRIGHQLRTE